MALGKDAIFLNKALKLKVTCMKKGLCKTGILVTHTFKYTGLMDQMGYGYAIYDYDGEKKKHNKKWSTMCSTTKEIISRGE